MTKAKAIILGKSLLKESKANYGSWMFYRNEMTNCQVSVVSQSCPPASISRIFMLILRTSVHAVKASTINSMRIV
jgi:hypothetical protein